MTRESSAARRGLVLLILCLSAFLVVIDNTIVNVALPSFSRDLGASNTSLQWIVDAYSLAFAGLLMAGGAIGDRLGRKVTMQAGLVAFGVFSLCAVGSHSTWALIGSRALMGAAAAFVFPATLSILTSIYPDPKERQKALGIWGATSAIAIVFGPIAGGVMLEHYWYGSVFFLNLPLVVIAVIAGQILIPRLDYERPGRFDTLGIITSTAGITALVLAIIEGPQWGWLAPGTLGCFAGALILLVIFGRHELRIDGPLLDVRIFAAHRFSVGILSIAIAFFSLFGFIFLITQFLQFVKGYSALSAGVHTLPFAVVAAIATPIGAVLALKIGIKAVVSSGLVLMGAGLILAGYNAAPSTAFFGPIIGSEVLLGMGLSFIIAPATEAVMGAVRADQVGSGAAVNSTARELGGTLGVAIFGSIFASSYAPKIAASFGHLPLSPSSRQSARDSMAGALEAAARVSGSIRPAVVGAADNAFGSGLRLVCVVGACVTMVGAVAAAWLLPGAPRGLHARPRRRRTS